MGITDYQDALLAEADGAPLLAAALQAGRERGASVCELTDLPPAAALRSAAVCGWRETLVETEACPVLAGAIPKGRRRDIRQALHRARRRGTVAVDTACGEAALAVLERLHGARWRSLGEAGVLADPRVPAFHRRALPELLADGAVELAVVRIGGQPAAACYTLHAPGKLLLYLSGFDPDFAFESPGTILLGRLIGDALAEGREVHFLRGAEDYKYAWGGVDRMNATRRLWLA